MSLSSRSMSRRRGLGVACPCCGLPPLFFPEECEGEEDEMAAERRRVELCFVCVVCACRKNGVIIKVNQSGKPYISYRRTGV
jgi:hypothetical protein